MAIRDEIINAVVARRCMENSLASHPLPMRIPSQGDEFRVMREGEIRLMRAGEDLRRGDLIVEPPGGEAVRGAVGDGQMDDTVPISTETIRLNDGTEISIDELRRGYRRQADYIRKTQEIARRQSSRAGLFTESSGHPPPTHGETKPFTADDFDKLIGDIEGLTND